MGTIKPRNSVFRYMIERNGNGVHEKSKKAIRRKNKMKIQKEIKEQ